MSTGAKNFGVTFGLGTNGTLRPPNVPSEEPSIDAWPTSNNWLRRWSGHPHLIRTYYLASTEDASIGFSSFRCSVTGDVFDRPITVETFTPHNSEWVSTFDLDRPPVFLFVEAPRTSDSMSAEGHASYRAVLWLKDFFGTSQRVACEFAGVPEATFYVWQNNPSSVARSAGARRALKLRASLEVAIARVGLEEVHRYISSGSPSIEDQLRNSRGAPWERIVSEIARFGTYELTNALPRISDPAEYLRRVRDVDETAPTDDQGADGARLMSEGEIREADQQGW